MSFTKRTTLDDEWQALTSADATGIVQIAGNGAAKLHLGQSEPGEATSDFAVIWDDGLAELPFYNAETGDILYGKRLGDSNVDVVVIASGTAPA